MTRVELDDLIEQLTTLDLDEEEAEVYLRLLQAGPSKVGDLSSVVSIGRSKLYRMLDDLAKRGVVTKGLERPTIYQAQPPQKVFEACLRELERKRDVIEGARDSSLDELTTLARDSIDQPVHEWKVLEGRDTIYDDLESLVETAANEVLLVANRQMAPEEVRLSDGLWRVLDQRTEAGVDVRVLAGDAIAQALEPAAGIDLRRLDVDAELSFALADATRLLTWVRWRPPQPIDGHDTALRTDAPGMCAVHRVLFEQLWQDSEPIGGSA